MTATPMLRTPAPPPGIPPDPGDAESPGAGTLAVANAALRGGFVLLPRTLLHAPGLSRDAKLLYAVLLSYAWQRGRCFPGYARLQHDLGCGINQVTRYLRELEAARLVTRRRRGLGKTTLYTLHDPPPPPPDAPDPPAADPEGALIHRFGESGVTETVKAVSPVRRHKEDSGEQDPEEHHPAATNAGPAPHEPPSTLAPTDPPKQEPDSAVEVDDDALLELLSSHGVTRRIAQELVRTHPREAIAQQVAWQPSRPPAKSPAGALVQAIRDAWPPPPAWKEAQEHTATVARQAEEEAQRQQEDEARRRQWEARPPEERIAGRLQFWLQRQRMKRHEPTAAEVAAKRAELLAGLAPVGGALAGAAAG